MVQRMRSLTHGDVRRAFMKCVLRSRTLPTLIGSDRVEFKNALMQELSLSLPLEKDVLRDALQFEPVGDWARGQLKQFKELSDAVKTHWEKASASRARLANRHKDGGSESRG